MDFAAEGLLDGLEGEAREARERLLRDLCDDGFTLEQLRAAVEEDRLVLLPVERLLGGRHTAAEVEEQAGVPASLMLRIRRLAGLPDAGEDDRVFSDQDVEVARSTRSFLEAGLSEEAITELTRVMGEAMARIAATTAGTFVESFLHAGDSELDVAHRFAKLAEELIPRLEPVFMASFTGHLREAIRRGMISRAQLETGEVGTDATLAVCFADVVGFTRLGSQVEVQELGKVAQGLAELAAEVTESPVRLVKTIGDAAMFVSPEAAPVVDVALKLVAAMEEAELPTVRAGVALGPAVQRAGDVFGHSVNLASRVTGIAHPGSILCTEEIHDAAETEFRWSYTGKHRLKGIKQPQPLHRARRLASD